MWVGGDVDDYIFYDRAAPVIRRNLIIGHEYGHIVFDADTPGAGSPHPVTVCQRTVYDNLLEQRAEVFGTVVLQRVDLAVLPQPPADLQLPSGVLAALEGRAGRWNRQD